MVYLVNIFLKVYSARKGIDTKIAVASHTPLHRSLGLTSEQRKILLLLVKITMKQILFIKIIFPVNSKLNKKYDIPDNFVKIYELKMHGIKIYEIFEK